MIVLDLIFEHPWLSLAFVLAVVFVVQSLHKIGPTEVGLVTKRFGFKKLAKDSPVAFDGEAGYQSDLLMAGLRWKSWPFFSVDKYPWVQVPAGEIGVVISQVGGPLPIGAKSAVYRKEFGNFANLRGFVQSGGQKGVQRPVLPPGTLAPIHPVGFLVITRNGVYGLPVSSEFRGKTGRSGELTCAALGLKPEQLDLLRIEPQPRGKDAGTIDVVGIVTTYEGDPLPSGDIATRLGGYADIEQSEKAETTDAHLIEALLGSKNNLHNNYQDFQAFLEHGGRMVCSTIRCSTAPTHSIRSWSALNSSRCSSSSKARSPLSRPTSASPRKTPQAPSSSTARSFVPGIAACGRSRCAPVNIR